jgi:hypothetical protein
MTTVRSREERSPSVGAGIAFGILSFASLLLAVLMALGEAGYHRTYGCFFSGVNIFDACGHPASGVMLLILGELLLAILALLCGVGAFRKLHPSREP